MENHVKLRLGNVTISKLSQFVRVGLLFLIVPLLQLVRCDRDGLGQGAVCIKTSSCECKFDDGSGVISLVTIASTTGSPRFPYTKAKSADPYFYAYNPCYSFSDDYCQDVAACQKNEGGKDHFDIGSQESATFSNEGTTITYTTTQGLTTRSSIVTLTCDLTATTPVLEVTGEETPNSGKYLFTLRSNCACKNGCLGGGISAGSVLCILFSVGVILYVVIGILFLKFVRGAEGKEVIPNFEFWKDFPILVKDGILFLAGGCKSDTNNYEQI